MPLISLFVSIAFFSHTFIASVIQPAVAETTASSPIVAGVSEEQPRVERVYETKSVGVALSAASSFVYDRTTQSVLWENNADTERSIASITKLITLAVLLEHDLDERQSILIQEQDLRPEGGNRHVYLGEEISLEDALHAVVLASDNEVTNALVRSQGYTAETFQQAVAAWLAARQYTHTHIIEPTGLDARNVSTAREIALIAKEVFSHDFIAAIAEKDTYTFTTINTNRLVRLQSTNQLLGSDFRVQYGKTGYTNEAGGCLVTIAQTFTGKPVISVVLGATSRADRFTDTKALLYWVSENYRWYN